MTRFFSYRYWCKPLWKEKGFIRICKDRDILKEYLQMIPRKKQPLSELPFFFENHNALVFVGLLIRSAHQSIAKKQIIQP